jgi:opacity protein-like surface antigen
MIRSIGVAILVLLIVLFTCPAPEAAPFNLAVSVGPSMPMGDFGEATDIIEPTLVGYDATGGGAKTGFGFNVELDVQAARRVYVGGRFGYSRFGGDADDIMNTGLIPPEVGVTGIDATWTLTSLGGFVRIVGLETPAVQLYGRVGLGASKMKNSFDVTFEMAGIGELIATSDFDLGNQFYFVGACGAEYKMWKNLYLMAEIRYTNVRSDGAEATAFLTEYSLTGTQAYSAQVAEAFFGVRIPLSGI